MTLGSFFHRRIPQDFGTAAAWIVIPIGLTVSGCTDRSVTEQNRPADSPAKSDIVIPLHTDFSDWCTDQWGMLHEDASACAASGTTPSIPDPPTITSGDPSAGGGGGGGSTPPAPSEPDTAKPCATGDPLLDAPAVQAAMDEIWKQSNYSPSTPQMDRREYAFWIVRNLNGSLSTVPWDGESRACGTTSPTSVPARVVGWVHSHPYGYNEVITTCGHPYLRYKHQPSAPDKQAAADYGVPAYLIDPDQIRRFGAQSDPQHGYGRCGY